MLNKVSIMGRITKELEMKTTSNGGHAVVSFSIATDRNYKENNEYPTDFFDIVAWRKTAEFICQYFQKGQMIAIDGKLQMRKYTDKNNNARTAIEIVVDNAFFCEKKVYNNAQNANNFGVQNYQNYAGQQPQNYAGSPQQAGYNAPNACAYPQNDNEFNGGMPEDFYPEFIK